MCQNAWQRQQQRQQALLLLLLLLSASLTCNCVAAHKGCGYTHPLVFKQHAILQRRMMLLQQQRNEVGTAAGRNNSSSNSTGNSSSAMAALPLRITPIYQLAGVPGGDAKRVQQQLVPAAIKVLQKYIKVQRPVSGSVLKVDASFAEGQQGCLVSRTDASIATSMQNSDLVLYITSEDNMCLPGMIAMASACDIDEDTKRPILGSLNVCSSPLDDLHNMQPASAAEATAAGRLVEVLVHEMIHVLGFGSTHYQHWMGPDGKLYGEKNLVKQVGNRPYLATPKVAAVARAYFGCSSLPGAPLENEGPSFSAISHFEYRLLQRELMTPARPIDRSRTRLSAFTLAVLEDTGWYTPDYSQAEVLDWGRNAGCSFVLDSCWDYIDKQQQRQQQQPYYCGKGSINQTRCTAEAAGWGVCRESAFSDGCLLVGKYSSSGSTPPTTATSSNASSREDGRQAACYSPPELLQAAKDVKAQQENSQQQQGTHYSNAAQQQQQEVGTGPLLPLLGGSYGAQRSDICYNLLRPQNEQQPDTQTDSRGRGQIPEDVGRPPAAWPTATGSSSSRTQQEQGQQQQGRSGQEQQPAGTGHASFTSYTYMDVDGVDSDVAAACVNMPESSTNSSTNSSTGSGTTNSNNTPTSPTGRKMLSGLELLSKLGRNLLAPTAAVNATALVADYQTAGDTQRQPSDKPAGPSAACISSPVLCFRSSCNAQGQLYITVNSAARSTNNTNSSSQTGNQTAFACPSGTTIDLARQLPGLYLLGYLQCPSNALVCETMGCGNCDPAGGYCSHGKCYCHMERYSEGCSQSLLPKLT